MEMKLSHNFEMKLEAKAALFPYHKVGHRTQKCVGTTLGAFVILENQAEYMRVLVISDTLQCVTA